MMNSRILRVYWVLLATVIVGLVIFAGMKLHPRESKHQKPEKEVEVLRGYYERYYFSITSVEGDQYKTANFTPLIVNDDSVMVGALKYVASFYYGQGIIADDALPAVEVKDENNYITFQSKKGKIFFQPFESSNGKMGSVRFWVE